MSENFEQQLNSFLSRVEGALIGNWEQQKEQIKAGNIEVLPLIGTHAIPVAVVNAFGEDEVAERVREAMPVYRNYKITFLPQEAGEDDTYMVIDELDE
jgi:hypothetical protein